VLTGGVFPGEQRPTGVSLSERLSALARLVQIGSARVGPDGFDAKALADAEALLARAGERLRLSSQHTIAVLAGGTGSGKSSLFNQLAGAQFSPAGVLRPVTREPHACVWGMEGAGPLLDWLGIEPRRRYGRSSALAEGERALTGLLLVDLPDHDSVMAGGSAEVTRLVSQADLMIWVLDPQKYADAAVHSRYLVPMAGHAAVIAAALNQADLLTPEQAQDCVADLRRLLDAEGLHDARVLVTSATSAAGVADLRNALMETVIARQAALRRISADVDAVAARFVPYAGDTEARARVTPHAPWAAAPEPGAANAPGAAGGAATGASPGTAPGAAAVAGSAGAGLAGADLAGAGLAGADSAGAGLAGADSAGAGSAGVGSAGMGSAGGGGAGQAGAIGDATGTAGGAAGAAEAARSVLPAAATDALATAFAAAAGVNGVGRALQSARELKAVDYVGWPVAWLADRVARRDPVRKIRLGTLWNELREVSAGATGAQQADISNAITALADEAGRGLPAAWQASVRQAARSNTSEIPGALGGAIAASLPKENSVAPWWRAVAAWQGLLLGAAAVGLGWLMAIIILGVFGAAPHASLLLRDVGLLPWVALMVAAILLLGWLTANGCMALVIREADREREQVQQRMRAGIADVARHYVVLPVERELSEFARFHDELMVARATV
jgi:GTP-binding protein EngB required for normal cell division